MKSLARTLLAFLLLSAPPACAESSTRSVRFSDSNPELIRFDALEFLGGVEWRADRGDFGGFSGLLLDPDGMITALTDKSHWAKARLLFDTNGHLTGIEGLEVGRLYESEGKYLQRPYMDSEAITRDGTAYLIAFERQHRVSRFETLKAPEQRLANLPDLTQLRNNRGIESLLKLPDGRLVMVAEEPPNGRHDHIGWIVDADGAASFRIKRVSRYSPTDIALGPDGETLFLLERRYSLLGGPGMRIRRFPLSALSPGARIEGDALIDIGAGHAVDNMEALATRRAADGKTELFVLSDDNFSARQRTLLLHFRVLE